MSIIIRLQNLPWDATSLNVRQFFYGLSIPDGGVHIIGGEKGDVFIAFSTDEDARQAMKNDGGFIGSTQIKLYLSSKAEMQSVITAARELNSKPQSLSNMGSMNQFGGPPGGAFPPMRMPFPNQLAGLPQPLNPASRFRGPTDPKEQVNFAPFPARPPYGTNDFRPNLDFRHNVDFRPNVDFRGAVPGALGNDFRPSMFDSRNTPMDQARLPAPFDQRQNFPFNMPFSNQSSMDDKQNRKGSDVRPLFPDQRMDPFWNGSQASLGGSSMQPRTDIFNGQPQMMGYEKKQLDSNDRMPLVMYPTNELFNKVNDKDRNVEKNDYAGFGIRDRYSGKSNQMDHDNRQIMDLEGNYRNVETHGNFDNDMKKILKNIDDRIAASQGKSSSLLATPNFKALPELNQSRSGGQNDDWKQGSSFRQRSRSPVKRDSKYNESSGNSRGGRSESSTMSGLYLRVENLPSSFNYRDIRNLFKDFEISKSGLKLMLDKNGHKNGEAYMRVASVIHMDSALKRDGKMVDGYRIRVARCHEKDFENVVNFLGDGNAPRNKSRSRSPNRKSATDIGGFYVVIKNLSHPLVWKCLDGVKIYKDGGPFIEIKPNGSETGHILVELEHRRDFQTMLDRCKKVYDGVPALVFGISRSEFKERIEGSKVLKKEKAVEKLIEKLENDTTCIKLNGLSWSSTEEKVARFFSGCKIVPKGLHILVDDNNKTTGDAYIEFETAADCLKAFEKNNQYLDNRYLVLTKMIKNEMLNSLNKYISRGGKLLNNTYPGEKRLDNNVNRNTNTIKSDRPSAPSDTGPCVLYMGNLSFRTQLEDILEFFEGYRVIPDSVQLQYKDDQPTGDGMVQFVSKSEAEKALKFLNRKTMLGRVVRLNF